MRTRKDGVETRNQILRAAAEVFGTKGFKESTNAEICRRCGANTALVNYHFSDKETLYRLAWEYAWLETCKKYPYNGGVSDDASSEDRLRGYIAALIRQNADSECYDDGIWRREIASPTKLLTEIRDRVVIPLRDELGKIIIAIVGDSVSPETIKLCTMSIIAQCRVPIEEHGRQGVGNSFLCLAIDKRIEHVYRFSMGGIMAIKASNEESQENAHYGNTGTKRQKIRGRRLPGRTQSGRTGTKRKNLERI